MELSFATRQLREFCINPLAGDLSSGDVIDLKARLAELAAAETLGEMPFGREERTGDRFGLGRECERLG